MSTKNDLIIALKNLGWEAANARILKPKFEEALATLKSGGTPDASFKRIAVPNSDEPKKEEVVSATEPEKTEVATPEEPKAKKEIKKKVLAKKESPAKKVTSPVKATATSTSSVVAPTPLVEETVVVPVAQVEVPAPKKKEEPAPVNASAVTLPEPQNRVEKNILSGTVVISSDTLIGILDSLTSLSSNDYSLLLTNLVPHLKSNAADNSGASGENTSAVNVTKKQISSVISSKQLDITKDEYLLFKKYYSPQISPHTISEKSGLELSKVYAAMMNSTKYASAYGR